MKKDFDFNRIGKRMPYLTPQGFFDEMEENLLKEVRTEPIASPKHKFLSIRFITGIAVAASITLLFIFNLKNHESHSNGFLKVEQAFSNLSSEDQTYMLEVYQDDIFMNE